MLEPGADYCCVFLLQWLLCHHVLLLYGVYAADEPGIASAVAVLCELPWLLVLQGVDCGVHLSALLRSDPWPGSLSLLLQPKYDKFICTDHSYVQCRWDGLTAGNTEESRTVGDCATLD